MSGDGKIIAQIPGHIQPWYDLHKRIIKQFEKSRMHRQAELFQKLIEEGDNLFYLIEREPSEFSDSAIKLAEKCNRAGDYFFHLTRLTEIFRREKTTS